ncbi:LysR family transcriptional regulator [Leeia oryzae]|uniref:LysR family transcriptional regulator n=1 Tax=Leeia oryzae TaxID=356662 RepID=UPI00035EEFFD|nr:LysR family transcriptional regulator [Leeia oryzae]
MQVQDADLKLLRIFDTIVKSGGFAAAQSALNLGASSISEYVSQLESRLGVRLCERGRSGFRLTDEGAKLHAASQRLLGAVDSFHMEAMDLRQQLQGQLRFGMVEATLFDEHAPLLPAVRAFGRMAPNVDLEVEIDTPSGLEQKVLDGRLHLAVGPFPGKVPGLVYEPLYTEEQGLYCASTHALFDIPDPMLQVDDIRHARFVARAYLGHLEHTLLGISRPAASVDTVEGRALLILSGNYIGFLPPPYAQKWQDLGLLRRLDASRFYTRLVFHVIQRQGASPSRAVLGFIDILKQMAT